MFNNYGKNRVVQMIGGSSLGSVAQILIGTGSSTVQSSDTALVTSLDRQTVTSISFPAAQKVSWQFNWNSVEMSGTALTEFGVLESGGGLTGSLWSRDVIPSLTFDGTNELRVRFNAEVF